MTSLIQSRGGEILHIFLFTENNFLSLMMKHLYSKSIAGVLILILSLRKDAKYVLSSVKERRIVVLETILDKALETCSNHSQIETHLNCINILGDCIQNWETIVEGKHIVKELMFSPQNFLKISLALADETKSSLGHLPNLLHLLFEFSKKNEDEFSECIFR
jgi:hypothetical protein